MIAMSYFPELDGQNVAELIRSFNLEPFVVEGDSDAEKTVWYAEAACKIAEAGKEGGDYLLSRIDEVDDLRLRAILSALPCFRRKTTKIRKALLLFLHDERPLIMAEAIDSARYLGYKDFVDQILPLQDHQSPYVVGSVLRYLSHHYPKAATPLLLDALEKQDPILLQNAIDALDELGYVDALPRIRSLVDHGDAYVRQAAQTAVANLESLMCS